MSAGFSRAGLLMLAGVVLTACAGSAPALPTDTTSTNRLRAMSSADFSAEDLKMRCTDIAAERDSNAVRIDVANRGIESTRDINETAAVLARVFVLPYAATEGNYPEKNKIAALQERQDVLIKLAGFKKCQ